MYFFDIQKGDFPLNHDCILKVVYNPYLSMLRHEYFTCRSQDSGILVSILKNIYVISKIYIYSVDDLCMSDLK